MQSMEERRKSRDDGMSLCESKKLLMEHESAV